MRKTHQLRSFLAMKWRHSGTSAICAHTQSTDTDGMQGWIGVHDMLAWSVLQEILGSMISNAIAELGKLWHPVPI